MSIAEAPGIIRSLNTNVKSSTRHYKHGQVAFGSGKVARNVSSLFLIRGEGYEVVILAMLRRMRYEGKLIRRVVSDRL
jgi:hypothetical protein